MSEVEEAERNFRDVLNSGRQPFRDDSYVLLAEYDRRGAELDSDRAYDEGHEDGFAEGYHAACVQLGRRTDATESPA